MRFSSSILAGALALGAVNAAPSQQLHFQDASLQSNAFASPAGSLFNWIHSAVESVTSSSAKEQVEEAVSDNFAVIDPLAKAFEGPDYSDKTIWQVIQEDELGYLTDLKHVLKYSGKATRELLDDKSKKLTFLIPINWRNKKHQDEELNWFNLGHWSTIEAQIREFDSLQANSDDDDDDKKKRKRKAIEYLIDSTIRYHVVDSHSPLTANELAQNSSVATDFSIGKGRAREVVGNLLDGEQFRLRVGKSLLPIPSVYFNFYSRLAYPDKKVGGSLVHAITLPLLLPSSTLQTLYFSSPDLAGSTAALQKTHQSGYLGYPFNRSAIHEDDDANEFAAAHGSIHHQDSSRKHPRHYHGKEATPQTALTYFVPSNLAWYRLPPLLRLFLQSPFGYHVLEKVLALHAVPYTVFYADFLHQVDDSRFQLAAEESYSAKEMLASPEWLWGATSESPSLPMSNVNVTRYTFKTACPKLHFNRTDDAIDAEKSKKEFETIDVAVYRYKILPGGRGPLQTRIGVQGVPVIFQDVAVGNGALHVIDRFIKPKGHDKKDASSTGIWAYAAAEAEKFGYGSIDLLDELM